MCPGIYNILRASNVLNTAGRFKKFPFFFPPGIFFAFSQVDGYSMKHLPYAKNDGNFAENLYHAKLSSVSRTVVK